MEEIMAFFHLDKEKCKRDGICSSVCVTGIIRNDEERSPYIDEKNVYKCISCGLCVAYCPHEACYVENLDPAQFSKVDFNSLATPEQLDTFIKTRRSVRNFRKTEVDEETLNKIMDNVRYAPSAKNTHNNRWIITKSREETVKLGDLVAQYMQEHISEVPEEHALHYKLLCRAYKSGRDVIMRDAPHIVVSVLPDNCCIGPVCTLPITCLWVSKVFLRPSRCVHGRRSAGSRPGVCPADSHILLPKRLR